MSTFTLVTPTTMLEQVLTDLVPLWSRSGDPKIKDLAARLTALPRPVDPAAVDVILKEAFADGHKLSELSCTACSQPLTAAARFHVDDFEDVTFCRECLLIAVALFPPEPEKGLEDGPLVQ